MAWGKKGKEKKKKMIIKCTEFLAAFSWHTHTKNDSFSFMIMLLVNVAIFPQTSSQQNGFDILSEKFVLFSLDMRHISVWPSFVVVIVYFSKWAKCFFFLSFWGK